MTINTDVSGTISGFVSVSTLGDVASNLVPFAISVCPSPIIKINTFGISDLVKSNFELNEDGGQVKIPKKSWGQFVNAAKCQVCEPNIDVVGTGLSANTATPLGLSFDQDENIVIDTTVGRDFTGYIVVSYNGDCADL